MVILILRATAHGGTKVGPMNDSLLDRDVNSCSIEENNAVVDGDENCVILSQDDAPAPIVMNILVPPHNDCLQHRSQNKVNLLLQKWTTLEFGTTAPKQYK